MKYVVERAKEASTWRGLVYLATSLGIGISPEIANAVIAVGIAIAGLISIIGEKRTDENNTAP